MNDVAGKQRGLANLLLPEPSSQHGLLAYGSLCLPCAVGRSGSVALKREGDGGTPRGLLMLRRLYYRADKVARPRASVPVLALRPDDGWCDAPGDRNYNRHVRLPYPASAENLWRTDDLYDLVGVLGWNDRPRQHGLGSCIFLHVASPDLAPTAGCLALHRPDLERLLGMAPPLRGVRTA